MIIPLKTQREFVNINFPEPKGASQLVCHLFTGPESRSLKLNRPLLDAPRAKSYGHNLWTFQTSLIMGAKKNTMSVPVENKQARMDETFLTNMYRSVLSAQYHKSSKTLSPFFFKKAFLVAKGLWRTFGFCRNFTAVVIWGEKSDSIPHNGIMWVGEAKRCNKLMLLTLQAEV